MVLKKSISKFNSGSTQKLCSLGAYAKTTYDVMTPKIFFILKGLNTLKLEDEVTRQNASKLVRSLQCVYEYLGISGPELSSFENSIGRLRPLYKQTFFTTYSLEKKNRRDISEKVIRLLHEKNFLNRIGDAADVEVERIFRIVGTNKIFKKQSCVHRACGEKVEEEKKQNGDDASSHQRNNQNKKRKNTAYRNRGIQRPHLHSLRAADKASEMKPESSTSKVIIQLFERDHVDVRCLGSPGDKWDPLVGWGDGEKWKSLGKTKGYVNGRWAPLTRGYDLKDISGGSYIETNQGVQDCIDDKDVGDLRHDIFPDDISEYCREASSLPCLGDWVSFSYEQRGRKSKSRKHDTQSRVEDDNKYYHSSVNTASSQTCVKHPKGSFQYIDRPEEMDVPANATASSSDEFELVDIKDISENFDRSIDNGIGTELDVVNQFNYDDNGFVDVNLHWPGESLSMMTDSIAISDFHLPIDKIPVLLGNCFPPMLSVPLQDRISFRDNNGWTLVFTSVADLQDSHNLKWSIGLKQCKGGSISSLSTGSDNVKARFASTLESVAQQSVSLNMLVDMATESIEHFHEETTTRHAFQAEKAQQTGNPNHKTGPSSHIKVLSTDAALQHLDGLMQTCASEGNKTHSRLSSEEDINALWNRHSPDNIDCDVCFLSCVTFGPEPSGIVTLLPCQHTFCFECWQTHIFHNVHRGNNSIPCMHTDCKAVLNAALMNALIPERILRKLHAQANARRIEQSSLCAWCPTPTCGRVAVAIDTRRVLHTSTDTATTDTSNIARNHFGRPVKCDCQRSWCFHCQSSPHWPASCEQTEAYRIIKSKMGFYTEWTTSVSMTVATKPCPTCLYPIEKFDGCNNMWCILCRNTFCWNCGSIAPHSFYDCPHSKHVGLINHKLKSDLENTFPLKYLDEMLDVSKKRRVLKRVNLCSRLNGLRVAVLTRKYRERFTESAKHGVGGSDRSLDHALDVAAESLTFVNQTFETLEYFYLLLGMAQFNKGSEMPKQFWSGCRYMADILSWYTSLLQAMVCGKRLRQISLKLDKCEQLLKGGRESLLKVLRRVKQLQRLSENVNAAAIGELEPKGYFRYK